MGNGPRHEFDSASIASVRAVIAPWVGEFDPFRCEMTVAEQLAIWEVFRAEYVASASVIKVRDAHFQSGGELTLRAAVAFDALGGRSKCRVGSTG